MRHHSAERWSREQVRDLVVWNELVRHQLVEHGLVGHFVVRHELVRNIVVRNVVVGSLVVELEFECRRSPLGLNSQRPTSPEGAIWLPPVDALPCGA